MMTRMTFRFSKKLNMNELAAKIMDDKISDEDLANWVRSNFLTMEERDALAWEFIAQATKLKMSEQKIFDYSILIRKC